MSAIFSRNKVERESCSTLFRVVPWISSQIHTRSSDIAEKDGATLYVSWNLLSCSTTTRNCILNACTATMWINLKTTHDHWK